MHYGAYFFSKNGMPTITAKKPEGENMMGNRKGMTEIDVIELNRYYGCDDGGNHYFLVYSL